MITQKVIPFYLKHSCDYEDCKIGFYVTDGEHYQEFSETFGVYTRQFKSKVEEIYQKMVAQRLTSLLLLLEEYDKKADKIWTIGFGSCYDPETHMVSEAHLIKTYPRPANYKIVDKII